MTDNVWRAKCPKCGAILEAGFHGTDPPPGYPFPWVCTADVDLTGARCGQKLQQADVIEHSVRG